MGNSAQNRTIRRAIERALQSKRSESTANLPVVPPSVPPPQAVSDKSTPKKLKTPLGRSTYEFVAAVIVAICCAIFPMSSTLMFFLMLFIMIMLVDVSWHSAKTINNSSLKNTGLSFLAIAVVLAVFYKPLTERYRLEREIPFNNGYVVRWGPGDDPFVITRTIPPKIISGKAECLVIANGELLMKYKDKFQLVAVAFHWIESKPYEELTDISKSKIYDISPEHIYMPIPLNDKYMTEAAATTATRTNFDLLAIPIGVKSEQFSSISQAQKLGAKVISTVQTQDIPQ